MTTFSDRLALTLDQLDTPAHFALMRSFAVGDDAFLYARCAVVVAGSRAYGSVQARSVHTLR
jgi:hypothetical protein